MCFKVYASEQYVEDKISNIKTEVNTRLNGLVDSNGKIRQIVMVDAVTGTDYVLKMRKGKWVSYISVPGLYDEDGNLLISWTDLTSTEYCTLTNDCCIEPQAILTVDENGVLNSANDKDECCAENLSSSYLQGHLVIPDGVTSIAELAFGYCTGLRSVTIPDSVTSIGDSAFYESGLRSVTIQDGVTSIGIWAFGYCTGLTSITIPDSIKVIGDSAFYGCTGLTSVIIPNSVTSIGDGTFEGCTGLTSVTIPNSVTSIGDSAFEGCTDLTSVYFRHTTTPTFKNKCFYKSSGNMCTFYFRNGTVADAFTTSYYNSSYGKKTTGLQ